MERAGVRRAVAEERDRDSLLAPELERERRADDPGMPPATTAFAPRFPTSRSYRCIEPPYPCEQPSSFPYSSAITSFTCVPFAIVCPCARCVEAITSSRSSAPQTPVATASCPIATCRKPGQLARAEALLDLLLEAPDEQHLAEERAQPSSETRLPPEPAFSSTVAMDRPL